MNTQKLMLGFSLAVLVTAVSTLAAAQNVRIVQTNSRADMIHLIDPATHSIVAEIKGIPVNHGAAAAPDGSRLYFSSEAKFTLDVVDTSTFAIVAEIPLSGRPNNITIGKDGRYVYVGIMQDPGGVDVIDTHTANYLLRIARSVELLGGQCIITGIRPAVAQTMVNLDTGFGGIVTLATLRDGIKYSMNRMGS